METKSRVELYKELRDKIANRDSYSFEETKTRKKHLPEMPKADSGKDGVTKTYKSEVTTSTLSLSVDELRKAKDEFEKKRIEDETKRRFREKQKKERKKKLARRLFLVLSLCVLLALIIVIAVMIGKGGQR